MKYLALIIVTFVCAALIVNGQEAKLHGETHKANSAPKDTNASDTAGQNLLVVNQQAAQRQENDHANKPSSYLHELFLPQNVPNLALVLVGIGGIVIAVLSLNAVNRQIGEMRRQVDLLFGQLRAMHEQVAEMSAQTGLLSDYVDETKNIAIAANSSADAAKKSADALVFSERAWVMADLRCSTASHFLHGDHTENGVAAQTLDITGLELTCVNDGNSPAWITEKAIRLVVMKPGENLPTNPTLTSKDIVQDHVEPLGPGRETKKVLDLRGEGRHSLNTATLIYGVVRYRDIFKEERETWFCYQMTGYKTNYLLARIPGSPEYNRNT
jgi:hypothetical protein